MAGKAPKAPTAPDPVVTASAQGAANEQAARTTQRMNMVDQYTPYGNLIYSDLGNDRFRADVQLSPEQQQLLGYENQLDLGMAQTANQQLGRVNQALSNAPNAGNYQQAGQVIQPEWARAQANKYYGSMGWFGEDPKVQDTQHIADTLMARQQPQMDAQRNDFQSQLMNRGIAEGSEAWKRGMDDWNRQQNDLRMSAQLAAGQEQSRLFGQDLSLGQFQNQRAGQVMNEIYAQQGMDQGVQDRLTAERQRQIQEDAYFRNMPINEIAALTSGAQIQNPQFMSTPQVNVGAAPIADSTYGSYQGQLQNYNSQLQSRSNMMSGLFGLAGSGAMGAGMFFSDARLKTGVIRIGSTPGGLGLYRFMYIWGGPVQIGVMAQEVARKLPHAVASIGGYLAVDYRKIV